MSDKPIRDGDLMAMPGTKHHFMIDNTLPITDDILHRYALAMGGIDVHYQVVDHTSGFKFRLTADYNGKQYLGEWCGYRSIARLDVEPYKFVGTTEHYEGILPRCFRIDDPYYIYKEWQS